MVLSRMVVVLLLLAACGSHPAAPSASVGVPAAMLRALTWNLAQPAADVLARQLDFIAAAQADIVILQEAYKGDIDQVRAGLSQRTGRVWDVRYAPQLRRLDGNDGGGIMAATALPVVESDHLMLPHPDRWTLARSVLRIRVSPPGAPPLDVFATHLAAGADATARERQADQLLRWTRGFDAPRILGGDINADPGDAVVRSASTPQGLGLSADFVDAFGTAGRGPGETFRSERPTRRIDYWFVGRLHRERLAPVEVTTLDVCSGPAGCLSDHRAVLARFELR